MMGKEKFEFLNSLYKNLRLHDVEILKHFCDDKITTSDYFFYGINNDIISNALNILTNYLSGNIESSGVDSSCRAILEAMVILKMDLKGDITDKQKEIYKYSYALVDFDNFRLFVKDDNEKIEYIKEILEDKKKAQKAIIEHFNIEKEPFNKKIFLNDPCFYLKKNINDDIRFSKLLEKYPFENEESIRMYEFFSLFIHPRCEMDRQTEDVIFSFRQIYIDDIIDLVYDYLKETKLLIKDASTSDFNDDLFFNPLLQNNVHNIKDIEFAFNVMTEQLCKLPTGIDWFTWDFLMKTKYLVLDMMTSFSLGYREHVISCFKNFIENYSVFYQVGTAESQNDFDKIKRGLWISSRIQIDCHFQNIGLKKNLVDEKEIKDIYECYYKDKYNLSNYNRFYWDFRQNSLYALGKEKKSYNNFVKKMIDFAYQDEFDRKEAMTLYKISKDMSHASGYNFNASEGVVNVTSFKVMIHAYRLILHFLLYSIDTLHEHSVEVNLKAIIDMFTLLIEMQYEGLKKEIDGFEKDNKVKD